MSSVSLRNTTSSRGRSAGPRLQTPMPALPEEEPRKSPRPQSRRVKSAMETRREQEFSGQVFPEAEKDPEWGTSSYSLDYGPKRPETPVPMRPISSTRRNNPHPDQSFLTWQYPVRIHEHRRAVPPDPNTWRFIQEGFYDDYFDDYNTGDAKNEVPVTNLAKIEFPGKKKKNGYTSTPHLLSGVAGTKAQLNPRPKASRNPGVQNSIRAPSPQSRLAHNTLRSNTLPVFKEWLKTASAKERDVLLQMLKVAHDDSEETRLQKVINDVLQPDSAERVQQWLTAADGSEKEIVLRVLETLAVAADDSDSFAQPDNAHYLHHHQRFPGRHRSQSYPISLRHRSSHHDHSHTHHPGGEYLQYSRHLPRPPSRQASSRNKSLHSSSAASGKSSGINMGLVVKKISARERKSTPWAERTNEKPTELWHHRIKKKTVGTSYTYPGSVWFEPNRDRGQHYEINPEFPTA